MPFSIVIIVKGVEDLHGKPEVIGQNMERVVTSYSTDIVRFAFAYVKNLAEAEDIAQDVFLVYLRKAPTFKDSCHEKAWLIRVTVNKCKDYLKSSRYRRTVQIPDDLSYMPQEDSVLLQTVLELDERYKTPVYLHYFAGYSIKQIARMLRMNPSTVGTRLARGRKILRDRLGDDDDE